MARKRTTYDAAFKNAAIEYVRMSSNKKTIAQCGRELNIPSTTLFKWVKAANDEIKVPAEEVVAQVKPRTTSKPKLKSSDMYKLGVVDCALMEVRKAVERFGTKFDVSSDELFEWIGEYGDDTPVGKEIRVAMEKPVKMKKAVAEPHEFKISSITVGGTKEDIGDKSEAVL